MASTSSCQPRVIIQIKSFAELQFLLDDQFSADSTCKRCGTIENVDLVLSNTPHYLTIVLNWASGRQSQDTHSEVLAGITSPLEADSATINYIVASMICYADERYACCAGDEGNWLIYNSETIEICYADERCICFAGDEANWLIYNSETIKICYADERYVYFVGGEGNWLIYNCETIKIKSFAELPFVLDDQYSLEHCGSGTIENVDLFLSDMPHCFTIVLNWASGSESLDAFSEVLAGITCPLEDEFFCRRDRSATKYIVASMICYADERYACFAGDEGNWMIYNSETIEICYADERYVCCARDEGHWLINDSGTVETVDTWEHLLESFKDCKLQPEVLFFEVIK